MTHYRIKDWCEAACSYIRFKPDRPPVYQELCWHLEDRQADYLEAGLDEYSAAQAAIADMGDPAETGRALAKAHRPYLGWLWRASQWLLALCLLLLLPQITSLAGQFASWREQRAAAIEASADLYDPAWANESRELLLLAEPDGEASAGGYTFSVSRAALWSIPDREAGTSSGGGRCRRLYFTLHSFNPRFWADAPYGALNYLTATDSLGNGYTNRQERGERAVVGNLAYTGPFACDMEMWIEGLAPEAEWIELTYDRLGVSFALRIPLTGTAEEGGPR